MAVQFGTNISDVNINLQGAKELSNKAKNVTIGDFVDVGQVTREAAGLAVQLNEQQKRAEAIQRNIKGSEGKEHIKQLVNSEGYSGVGVTDTDRAAMLESFYAAQVDMGDAYMSGAADASGAEYNRMIKGRTKETELAFINQTNASYSVWKESQSKQELTNYPNKGEGAVPQYKTNRDAGVAVTEFIKEYSQTTGVAIPAIKNQLITDTYVDSIENLGKAKSQADLDARRAENEENLKPLRVNQVLNTREKIGAVEAKAAKTAYDNVYRAMASGFTAQSKTQVSLAEGRGFDSGDINNKYTLPPSAIDFKAAYGDKWQEKEAEYTAKYNKYEETRTTVTNPVNMEDMTYWGDQDTLVIEGFKKRLTDELTGSLGSGTFLDMSETIYNHGQVDSKRLDPTKQFITSTIVGGSAIEADGIVKQINDLRVHDRHAFNSLYPDREDRMKLIALDSIKNVTGLGTQENYKYLSGAPTTALPVLTRTEQSEKGKVLNDDELPDPVREDMNSLYTTLTSYGMSHSEAIKEIKKYRDTEPYKESEVSPMQKVKNVYADELAKIMVDGDTTYEHHGVLYIRSKEGYTRAVDKEALKKKAGEIKTIQEYNKNHWVAEGTKKLIGATYDNVGKYSQSVANYVNFYTANIFTEDKGLGKMINDSSKNVPTTLQPKATEVPENESIFKRLLTGKISYRPGKGWVTYNKEKK